MSNLRSSYKRNILAVDTQVKKRTLQKPWKNFYGSHCNHIFPPHSPDFCVPSLHFFIVLLVNGPPLTLVLKDKRHFIFEEFLSVYRFSLHLFLVFNYLC